MPRQLSLIKDPRRKTKLWWIVKQTAYGGAMNYRKVKRPFDSKKLTHAVFKAELGREIRFSKFDKTVNEILKRVARKYGIQLKDTAVNPDHIHILFYTKSREAQTRFLRLFSAELGRRYASLRRRMGYKAQALWVARPFTRLVSWGRRSLERVRRYIQRNRHETLGFIKYQPRAHKLAEFLKRWEAQRPFADTA